MGIQELLIAASAAAIATGLGAFMVLPFKKVKEEIFPILISFSAGLMAYSALEMLLQSHASAGDIPLVSGFLIGILFFIIAEKLLPHAHLMLRKKELKPEKKKAAMVFGTITLHNVPEGFAIASAFAGATPLGWIVAAAIAIQDFPEGFLASSPLACYGMEGKRCVKYGILSGLVEFAAAVLGFIFLSYVTPLIPYALSFAAGAMTYVILVELLPDAFVKGSERRAAISFILGAGIGFALATLLAF